MRTTPADGGMNAEMSLGDQRIVTGQSSKGWGMISSRDSTVATMGVFVYVDDVDQHYARARAASAEIVDAPRDESPATSMGIRGSLPLHRADSSGRASGARGPCEGGVRHRRGRR